MKKILYLAAVAMAFLSVASCDKNAATEPDESVKEATYGNVKVSFNIPDKAVTKALTTSTKEKEINSVHVFIFNKTTGKRETDRYETITNDVTGSYTMTLTSLVGDKIVWAVVNSPRITNVADETALKQKVSLLGENAVDNLLMSGYNDNVTVDETNANIPGMKDVVTNASINVYRLGARISLEKVTVDFSGTDLDGATFAVTGLYLKNVVGQIRIDGASSGSGIDLSQVSAWYNMGKQANVTSAPAAIQAITTDMPLNQNCNTKGTDTALGYSWYVYPNATTKDQDSNAGESGGSFSVPRRTRLVIKGHLGGTAVSGALNEDTYYVFSIPGIERNHAYNITSLKITMRGKPDDNDDTLTDTGQLSATITVQNWAKEETLQYEI